MNLLATLLQLRVVLVASAALCLLDCGGGSSSSADTGAPGAPSLFAAVPINDLGTGTYKGFQGGLFPGGSDAMPLRHASDGTAFANGVQPLDDNGAPSAAGKIVLLSIGLSNTTEEWCCGDPDQSSPPNANAPNPWTFMGQASVDATGAPHAADINGTTLRIVDGAKGGQDASCWVDPFRTDLCPDGSEYDRIRDNQLSPRGLTEKQVQVVWIKLADAAPSTPLPDPRADAFILETRLAQTLRALKVRYPSLTLAFLSSRIYAGYATTTLNPEPYAYESGFAVKFLIEAQIAQIDTGRQDAHALDLDYRAGTAIAPWISWGPYLWASGTTPRSDGLTWEPADFGPDGTHPTQSGATKVANMLMTFFKTSNQTSCWFLTTGQCL